MKTATIYDSANGGELLTGGLATCEHPGRSYEAIRSACRLAESLGRDVILHDADGYWLVHPDGTAHRCDPKGRPWTPKETDR